MRRAALLAATIALVAASCASDPLDTYSVPDAEAPPATLGSLPTTTTTATAPAEPLENDAADAASPETETETETEVVSTFAPNGETVDVRSLDNSFIQQQIEVVAGTEVNWINGGRNDHDILPVDESLTWGIDRDTFVPGTEYSHVFETPGVYPYYCSIHGTSEVGMIGAVIVTRPA